jgi:hypothetical protein
MADDSGNQPTHYFAATPHRFQRGRTRAQAIDNLRRATPEVETRNAIRTQGGLYVRTWHVQADMVKEYTVDPVSLAPAGVSLTEREDFRAITIDWRLNPVDPDDILV